MLKNLLYTGCLVCLLFSCNEADTYRINVNLSNMHAQNVYAVFDAAGFRTVDSLLYDGKGGFVLTQKNIDYRTVTIYFDDFTRWIVVHLETPRRIAVSGDALFPQSVQIKGGRINELLSDFRKETATLSREQALLLETDDTIQEQLNEHSRVARLANINHEIRLQAEAFIQKYPDEKASAILIRDYFVDPDHPLQMDNLLDILNPELDDFYVVQDLKSYTARARQTIVGAKAPDFNVRNIYGNTFSRDSFANHYFILAFTSLWSDMCQTTELLLDDIITSFPKDSLHVMLVTLDENQQELRQTLSKDPVRWNIVTDSVGQAIGMLDTYNINVLPRCFLLDKEGTIILKTENGVELIQMLEQLIPQK